MKIPEPIVKCPPWTNLDWARRVKEIQEIRSGRKFYELRGISR